MAKMFYTLEETAARLGVSEDQVKQMAGEGKLQQFRDRDKLMFKRDQVDALAGSGGSAAGGSSVGLSETGAGDAVDILGDTDAVSASDATDPGTATGMGTGISVFDTSEIDHADPRAQTQLTNPSSSTGSGDDLALDSVGSGSGLLDLTRESDDTSLGVALDEIYPGGAAGSASGSGTGTAMESAVGSSGVFESALGMESAAGVTGSSSGLDNLTAGDSAVGIATGAPVMAAYDAEAYDPAGSGFGAGVLLGALVALILGLIVCIGQLAGAPSGVTTLLTGSGPAMMWVYLGGLFVVSLVLGFIGMAVGRSAAR